MSKKVKSAQHPRILTNAGSALSCVAEGSAVTLEQFFAGHEESRQIFETLRRAVAATGLAHLELRVTKGQIAFRHRRPFAWASIPATYLRGDGAPLVLTVALLRRDLSPRWKQVVEPAAGRFTHHLELRSDADVDDQVRAWLREAWGAAA
jgi:hypothetical protein